MLRSLAHQCMNTKYTIKNRIVLHSQQKHCSHSSTKRTIVKHIYTSVLLVVIYGVKTADTQRRILCTFLPILQTQTKTKHHTSTAGLDNNKKGGSVCTEILGTQPQKEFEMLSKATTETRNLEKENWKIVLHIAYNYQRNHHSFLLKERPMATLGQKKRQVLNKKIHRLYEIRKTD